MCNFNHIRYLLQDYHTFCKFYLLKGIVSYISIGKQMAVTFLIHFSYYVCTCNTITEGSRFNLPLCHYQMLYRYHFVTIKCFISTTLSLSNVLSVPLCHYQMFYRYHFVTIKCFISTTLSLSNAIVARFVKLHNVN